MIIISNTTMFHLALYTGFTIEQQVLKKEYLRTRKGVFDFGNFNFRNIPQKFPIYNSRDIAFL